MKITGTIQMPDGGTNHLTVEGASYEEARAALEDATPDGTKLIVIRTDR